MRSQLLALHRTATLRHNAIGSETLLNLLLRNYLHYNLYDQVRAGSRLRAAGWHLRLCCLWQCRPPCSNSIVSILLTVCTGLCTIVLSLGCRSAAACLRPPQHSTQV